MRSKPFLSTVAYSVNWIGISTTNKYADRLQRNWPPKFTPHSEAHATNWAKTEPDNYRLERDLTIEKKLN